MNCRGRVAPQRCPDLIGRLEWRYDRIPSFESRANGFPRLTVSETCARASTRAWVVLLEENVRSRGDLLELHPAPFALERFDRDEQRFPTELALADLD